MKSLLKKYTATAIERPLLEQAKGRFYSPLCLWRPPLVDDLRFKAHCSNERGPCVGVGALEEYGFNHQLKTSLMSLQTLKIPNLCQLLDFSNIIVNTFIGSDENLTLIYG